MVLAVGGEALHLFLPESIITEGDGAGGMEQAGDEIIDGGSGLVELLLLGAVHGLDVDLRLEQADELLADAGAGGGGGHCDNLLHGRQTLIRIKITRKHFFTSKK